jgi:hypothetical protein
MMTSVPPAASSRSSRRLGGAAAVCVPLFRHVLRMTPLVPAAWLLVLVVDTSVVAGGEVDRALSPRLGRHPG